ncbi:hypothetical protein thsps21_12960 [Pseudomonas sp. No.21]|uniref:type II TA system antitoxin MqsA family protein n=1 Tax=Pseudomonas tohonis TaxID=2725477 RepID=UPI001F15B01B|nr:type II TA system antitoxin MqsA family protein [Pseudomonas tohonis]GJN44916.1 hypothetical protein TUM20249_09020 [Pseudomonas tohonis]
MKCPICSSEGTLSLFQYEFEAKTADKCTVPVMLDAYSCAHCGEEVETPEITKKNNIAVARAKADHYARSLDINRDSIPEFIKAFRAAFEITQGALTELFDSSEKAISKYELGSIIPSRTITKFIRLIIQRPIVLDWLREMDDQDRPSYLASSSRRAVSIDKMPTNRSRLALGGVIDDLEDFQIAKSLALELINIETVAKSVAVSSSKIATPLTGAAISLHEINTSTMTAH